MSFNIIPVASEYQEMHPYSVVNVSNIKINTKMMRRGGGGRQQSWRAAGGGRRGRTHWPLPRAGVPTEPALASWIREWPSEKRKLRK